jgi:signal transduction histidine kinase
MQIVHGGAVGGVMPIRRRPADGIDLAPILESVPVGIALYETRGGDFEVLYCNAAYQRFFAGEDVRVEGRPLLEVVPQAEELGVVAMLRNVCANGQAKQTRVRAGGHVWTCDAYPVTDPEGQVTHVLTVAQEITEPVHYGERMHDLEQAKSQFLRLASHELRGPIGVLRGYLSMIQDGSLGPMPKSLAPILPTMSMKADQMHLMINKMLESARLEDSRLQLSLQDLDLRELARRGIRFMRPMARPRQRIVLESPAQKVPVRGDPLHLETIITNLLDNAIKYSLKGQEVRVRVTVEGDRAHLTVRDNGVGITAEDLPRLFTRFERLPREETSHVSGTGLGLYLSRELARLHDGELTATSRVHQGSEFTLSLPLRK